mmetsp:Transcript_47378/g.83911  ORF Transcript_47378/g.83911 Transcript_47378/m.83911 type:complete len:222 (+) Transcript_47378:71-736(+)
MSLCAHAEVRGAGLLKSMTGSVHAVVLKKVEGCPGCSFCGLHRDSLRSEQRLWALAHRSIAVGKGALQQKNLKNHSIQIPCSSLHLHSLPNLLDLHLPRNRRQIPQLHLCTSLLAFSGSFCFLSVRARRRRRQKDDEALSSQNLGLRLSMCSWMSVGRLACHLLAYLFLPLSPRATFGFQPSSLISAAQDKRGADQVEHGLFRCHELHFLASPENVLKGCL